VFPVEEDAWQECGGGALPGGWCCENGDVYYSTEHNCLALGGTVFPDEEDAWKYCESQVIPSGWCCVNGQVYPESQAMCTWSGGQYFSTQSEAEATCQATPGGMPDLVITEVSCDVGNQHAEYVLSNIGNQVAAGNHYITVIVSGDTFNTVHYLVTESLDPGETYRGVIKGIVPWLFACDMDITVCADYNDYVPENNLIEESNESNNCLQITCPPCEAADEGWCCRDGNVVSSSQSLCLGRIGGTFFSTQREALQYCGGEIPGDGWCCRSGTVFSTTQDACTSRGGSYFTTQELADGACPPYIRYFTVSPTSLAEGERYVTLSWEVMGADDVTLSGIWVAGPSQWENESGTAQVEAVGTWQHEYYVGGGCSGETHMMPGFTLTATNSAGTVTRTVSVLCIGTGPTGGSSL
jgi:hypothetical protein